MELLAGLGILGFIFAFILFWVSIPGLLCGWILKSSGRSFWWGFVLGVIFGPLGLLVSIVFAIAGKPAAPVANVYMPPSYQPDYKPLPAAEPSSNPIAWAIAGLASFACICALGALCYTLYQNRNGNGLPQQTVAATLPAPAQQLTSALPTPSLMQTTSTPAPVIAATPSPSVQPSPQPSVAPSVKPSANPEVSPSVQTSTLAIETAKEVTTTPKATPWPISEDDKHMLYQAADITKDEPTMQEVLKKIGLVKPDGTYSTDYPQFVKDHEAWLEKNTAWVSQHNTVAKAFEYLESY